MTSNEKAHEKGGSAWGLWLNYGFLVAFTFLTLVCSELGFAEPVETLVAMAFAFAKALLVVLFFMHLFQDRGLVRIFAFGAVLFAFLLVGVTMFDRYERRRTALVDRRPDVVSVQKEMFNGKQGSH